MNRLPAWRRRLLTLPGVLALNACSPIRVINALVPSSTYVLTEGVAYGPSVRHRLDVYRPSARPPAGGFPLAVFFYGGSWNSGERSEYRFVGEALASRGIVALVADYRLYPEVSYPAFLDDCAAAVAHGLRMAERYGANPALCHVMGHSAGAYNAAMVALDPRWLAKQDMRPDQLAGWIGLAGPYDFVPIGTPAVQPVFHHPNVPPDSQPIVHADRSPVRSFLGAATDDSYVDPQRNTAQLARRLSAAGTSVTLRWYPRVNHLTLAGAFARPLRFLAPVLDDVAGFIHAAAASPDATSLRSAISPPGWPDSAAPTAASTAPLTATPTRPRCAGDRAAA